MNYLFNDRNLVRAGVLSALNVVPSSAIFRTDLDAKEGSGSVTLSGPYTGQHDTVIDVEVLNGTGDSSQVSQPVFTGVGNGTLSDLSVTGLDAQDFTVSVSDLGTQTVRAIAPLQGATLQAIAPGQQGNLISIAVDDSAIVRAPLDPGRALQGSITAGTNTYTGTQWDFGAVALDASGNIPDSAPRISFGDDPQVYRAYKDYDYNAQQWVFSFSPPPVRDVAQGAVVKGVTGTWGMVLSDGTTTETYSGIVSLKDALDAIHDAPSALCTVFTAITNNHQPGGMAATDLSVWTQPLVLSITEDGSVAVHQAVINFAVTEDAPTETVVIRCTDATTIGAEIWSVSGDITQGLPPAVTGIEYADGPYTFTIPVQRPTATPPNGNLTVDWNPGTRADGVSVPTLCIDLAQLGALAQNRSYTFTLKKKPAADCDCNDDHPTGGPSAHCLGTEPEGGENVTDESRLIRLQRLTSFVRTFKLGVTVPPSVSLDHNLDWVDDSASIFHDCLNTVATGTLELDTWALSTVYAVDDMREASPRNGYRYAISAVTGDATSGATPPTFPTTVGDTVTDHNVTWKNIGKTPWGMYDDAFDQWTAEANDMLGDPVTVPAVPPTPAGPPNSDPDPLPYIAGGYTVYDPDGSYAEGKIVVPSGQNPLTTHFAFELVTIDVTGSCITGTNSPLLRKGGTEPTWVETLGAETSEAGQAVCFSGGFASGGADATISWKCHINTVALGVPTPPIPGTPEYSFYPNALAADVDPDFFERYQAMANDVIAAAGIDPSFKSASVNGDGCWQDFHDNVNWWENTDGPLLPFQTEHGYHSARLQLDPDTGKLVPMTTEEFFLRLKFGCVDGLAVGDSFTVNVSGVSGGGGLYQEGDTISVVVAHQDPVPFGGGQLGNDMVTFSVSGTADAFPPYHVVAAAPAARINSHSYLLGDLYTPATPNGHFYECTDEGTSASSPPAFTTDRSEFTDGTASFQDMGLVDGYDEGGLAMTIVQGAIRFALADSWRFSAIGGHFQWRQDGGSWTGPVVIGSASLVAGLMANFTGGAEPPSWAAGDRWTFSALAINGPDQAKAPTDGRLSWTTSTTIVITPGTAGPASRFAIFDHHIPSDATITLQGSDDGFSTTPTSIVLPWKKGNIFATFSAVTRAAWRLVVNRPGDLFWLFLGAQMQPMLRDPATAALKPDAGHFTRRRRAAGIGVRPGIGGDILHDVVCADSLDDFEAGFDYACANDGKAFGLVINDAAGEIALVRFTGTELETKEVVFDYQASRLDRYQSFTLPTEALP